MITAIGCLLLIVIALGVAIYAMGKSNKMLKKEKAEEQKKNRLLSDQITSLKQLHNKQQDVKEKADESKTELAKTDNSNIVNHANSLFP